MVLRPSTVVSTSTVLPWLLLRLTSRATFTMRLAGSTVKADFCGETRLNMWSAMIRQGDDVPGTPASWVQSRRCSSYEVSALLYLMRHCTQRSPELAPAWRRGAL